MTKALIIAAVFCLCGCASCPPQAGNNETPPYGIESFDELSTKMFT